MVDRGTQKPITPMIQWKNQAYRRKREMRADIIEIVQDTKMKFLVCAWSPEWPFARDSTQQKNDTLHLVSLEGSVGPTLLSLVKEYQESAVKEKKTRKKEQNGKIMYISNSLKNSRITPTREKTTEHALQKQNWSNQLCWEAAFLRRWQKTPTFHCCYGLSIPCFTGSLSLFIQNSYYSISPL